MGPCENYKHITINKLFEVMAQKLNYKKEPIHASERLGDIKHSILDNSKCSALLGFTPKTLIEDGLGMLV